MISCPDCSAENMVHARFCNFCGTTLADQSADDSSEKRIFIDVAHPVNEIFRHELEQAILSKCATIQGLIDAYH